MTSPIRIILVDDHDLVRESWKMMLDKDDRFAVIAQCKNGRDAITEVVKLLPDITLMDINMSPVDGFEATKKIIEAIPEAKIIAVSANNSPRYSTKMFAYGAKGFVTKTSPFTELKLAIEKVHNGETYLCNEIKSKSQGEY
jgi:DNA-binding NarL/FixJ family response regulator